MIVISGDLEDADNGPNFRRKAEAAGLSVRQCERCRGVGYVSARLLIRLREMAARVQSAPNELVPVAKETCPECDGRGWWPMVQDAQH